MIIAYVLGCAMAAVTVGYQTPHDTPATLRNHARDVLVIFTWPIIVLMALGHGFRAFVPSKIAEDGGKPWINGV